MEPKQPGWQEGELLRTEKVEERQEGEAIGDKVGSDEEGDDGEGQYFKLLLTRLIIDDSRERNSSPPRPGARLLRRTDPGRRHWQSSKVNTGPPIHWSRRLGYSASSSATTICSA